MDVIWKSGLQDNMHTELPWCRIRQVTRFTAHKQTISANNQSTGSDSEQRTGSNIGVCALFVRTS